jgi:Cu2+-exporting ATPase
MNRCLHCSEITLLNSKFCCLGCKVAFKIINSLELNQYYQFCQEIYSIKPGKIQIIQNTINYMEFIKTNQNEHSIELIIEGIKCGSCIWLIENILKKQNNILKASVNASTQRLSIIWHGNQSQISEYIKIINEIGYKALPLIDFEIEKSQSKLEKNYLQRIALTGVIWIQNMMISMGIWGDVIGEIGVNSRIFMNICAAFLTIPIIIYSSKPFFITGWNGIKNKRSHMDIPISIAIIITLLISVYSTIVGTINVFYEAVSGLVFALLTGRYLELKVRNQANNNARNLLLQKPLFATVMRNNQLEFVSIYNISVGEIIYIASGETVALDGEIIQGISEIDNSIITGESLPIKVDIGDKIFAGSVNLGNPIQVKVDSDHDNSLLTEIKKLIEKSSNQKSKYQTLASKIASFYTPLVLIISSLTIIGWLFVTSIDQAIINGVSVLVITCPCAMGLAVPIVNIVTTSNLMRRGIFIKTNDALERLTEITTIALDKTGVLTYGKPNLINDINDIKYRDLLKSLVIHSKHHLCLALYQALKQDSSDLKLDNVIEEKGCGLIGYYKEFKIMIGRASWCGVNDKSLDGNLLSTWYVVRQNNEIVESIQLKFNDSLCDDAMDFINTIRDHYKIFIISGDRKAAVENIAKQLQINDFYYELSPKDKYQIISSNKEKILMIGDGLNDAAAMSVSHCSMSPSNIIEISQNQSSIIFQHGLKDVICILKIAKTSQRVCKENIIISIIYNIISIPIAISGYASPLIAAIFMSLSSILVIINSIIRFKK